MAGAPAQAEPRPRFRLSGPARAYDPAVQAIRPDLADIAEAAHHFAPHYARPAEWCVTVDCALLASTDDGAEPRAQLSAGSTFALLDLTGDWAWGYSLPDHIVGYVPAGAIQPTGDA